MPTRPTRLAVCLALPLLAGCAQYGRVLMEFDSVTGFHAVGIEPRTLDFRADATRWPWLVRQLEGSGIDVAIAKTFSVEPGPKELENPSEFVRERVGEMVEFAGDDLLRTAAISRRLCWLAAIDGQTLDELVTLDAIEAILRRLDVDPLAVPFTPANRAAALDQRKAQLATIERFAPSQRNGKALDAASLEEYVQALRAVAAFPSGAPATDRATVDRLAQALREEDDGRLREATATALAAVTRNTLADTMRRALVARSAKVRQSALLAVYRLSGPEVVPFVLFQLTVAAPRAGVREYDPDEGYRRTLLQVCAGLPETWLDATFAGGPPPIEYVYDTAVRDPSEGLRRIGLSALAHCLGRPVSFDSQWANDWWRERALHGESDAKPAPSEPRRPPPEGNR